MDRKRERGRLTLAGGPLLWDADLYGEPRVIPQGDTTVIIAEFRRQLPDGGMFDGTVTLRLPRREAVVFAGHLTRANK